MQNFKDLQVWKKSHANALVVYELTKSFPKEEQFGLVSQLRRAAVSIPTNIAEGCGKFTQKDLASFLQIALGSSQEVEYLLLFCHELKFISDKHYSSINHEVVEVKAMLISLIKKVRAK